MKKLLGFLLVTMMIFVLVACGGTSDIPEVPETPTALDISSLAPSGRIPQNPTEATRLALPALVFYYAPDIIYTTTAAENGLDETFMFVTGVVDSFDIVETTKVVFIQTEKGKLMLFHSQELAYSNSLEWDSIEIGSEYGFFFMYSGFSMTFDIPVGTFLNIYSENGQGQLARPETLGITQDQVLEIARTTRDMSGNNLSLTRTFDLGGDRQVTERIRSLLDIRHSWKLFVYHLEDTGYASTIILSISPDANSNAMTATTELYNEIKSLLPPEVEPHVIHGSDVFGDNLLFVLTVEHDIDFDFDSLAFRTAEMALTDFFASEGNIDRYNQLTRAGDYRGLYELVKLHIENNDAQPYDSAWFILEYLEPLLEVIDQVEIVYDAFDDVATIFYRGLTDVSRQYSLVPYTTTRSNSVNILIGFQNSSWIFADSARVRFEDGEMVTIGMSNSSRIVLDGGRGIRETVSTSDSNLRTRLGGESLPYMIRFEGRDHQLDRTLTEEEQNAFEVVSIFQHTNVFPSILSMWENR